MKQESGSTLRTGNMCVVTHPKPTYLKAGDINGGGGVFIPDVDVSDKVSLLKILLE